MISEELKKIKSFGSGMESSVTPGDIAAKEAELGIRLPEALADVYLAFGEGTPVFSESNFFVPLDELEITERGNASSPRRMVIIAKWLADGTGDGFFLDDKNPGDPQVYRCRTCIKKPGDRSFLMPENGTLSVFLLWHIGFRQLQQQRNVIQVSGKQFETLWDSAHDDWNQVNCRTLSGTFDWFLGPHPTNKFDLRGRPQQSPYGFVGVTRQSGLLTCLSLGHALIALCSEEQLGGVVAEVKGGEWKWVRKHDGSQASGRQKAVKERKLESILPAIRFLKAYACIQESGVSKEECAMAEARIGFSLPAPLKEVWENMPPFLLGSSAVFLSLDRISAEGEKVHFLSGEQGVPKFYMKKASPVVYVTDEKGDDIPFDLLDGFLIAELFWNIMRDEKAGSVLAERADCSRFMLSSEGRLGRFLKPCCQTMTKGCKRQLYHWSGQGVLGLYDKAAKILYLSALGEAPLRQLEKVSGVGLSWL